jgi:taurine dioxygenase
MKNVLENLEELNSSNLRPWLEKKFDYENLSDKPVENFHKIIKSHSITTKKSIYVNSIHTQYIKDFDKDESDIILKYIFEKIKNEKNCYRHKWEEDTIAIWDNRCCQHLPIDDCQ